MDRNHNRSGVLNDSNEQRIVFVYMMAAVTIYSIVSSPLKKAHIWARWAFWLIFFLQINRVSIFFSSTPHNVKVRIKIMV